MGPIVSSFRFLGKDHLLTKKRVGTLFNVSVSLVFVVVAVVIVVLVNRTMRQQALVEAESKARILLDRNLATHTYFSHDLKPAVFALTEGYREEEYFDPAWMSSTYAVRQIDGYFKELSPSDYFFKDAAISARSPENEADDFERSFVEALRANPDLGAVSGVRSIGGETYFYSMRRGEMMEESCLRCHSTPDAAPADMVDIYGAELSFDRDVGEVISVVSIRIPLEEAYAAADRFSLYLSGMLLMMLAGLFAAQWLLGDRIIYKPLAALRSKAVQIAIRHEHLGEEIAAPDYGREMQELTAAFNAMSLGLRRSVDQLEERVRERTAELQTANQQLQQEIREREAAEEKLRQQERLVAVGQLAGGIAHDFNNLLTSINGFAELIQLQVAPDDPVHELADRILESGGKTAHIVSQLLAFSSRQMISPQIIDMTLLLQGMLRIVRKELPENIQLQTTVAPDLWSIEADPRQIERMLLNLTRHAIGWMAEGGTLQIEAANLCAVDGALDDEIDAPHGDCVVIKVHDTGEALSQGTRAANAAPQAVFEPFYIKSQAVADDVGLRLAAAYGIVKQNRGHIWLESKPDEGNTFWVTLPRHIPKSA
jgi:signal transduction histidine kinase